MQLGKQYTSKMSDYPCIYLTFKDAGMLNYDYMIQEGIYNPWSVLQYMKNKVLQPYWVNTSSNDLIKMILKDSYYVNSNRESGLGRYDIMLEPKDVKMEIY